MFDRLLRIILIKAKYYLKSTSESTKNACASIVYSLKKWFCSNKAPYARAKKICAFFAVFVLIIAIAGGSFAKINKMRQPAPANPVLQVTDEVTEHSTELEESAPAPDNNYVPDKISKPPELPSAAAVEEEDEALTPDAEAMPDEPGKAITTLKYPMDASAVSPSEGFKYSDMIPMSYELQAYTYNKCVERGLEYELVLAIIWRESRFTPDAVHYNANGTCDNGIMQINDVNRYWLRDKYGIDDLMDPYQNIDGGTAMLGEFNNKYGSHYALLAYQFGESGMKQQIEDGYTTNRLVELAYEQRDYYRQII